MADKAELSTSKIQPFSTPTPFASQTPFLTPPPSVREKHTLQSEENNTHNWLVVDLSANRNKEEGSTALPQENLQKAAEEHGNKRWNSLLKSAPPSAGSEELCYIDPIYEEGKLIIDVDLLNEGSHEWENRVVGFFLDKKLPFSMVKDTVEKKWTLKGSMDLALDGDMYYFTFHNEEDRAQILDEGSFFIAGKLFVIRAWSREVEENRGSITSVPIWVKMFNVPKYLWNKKGLSLLEKEIPNSIVLKVKEGKFLTIPLEYPWKPLVCNKCHVFGHKEDNCERKVPENQAKKLFKVEKGKGGEKEWQTVKKTWRKKFEKNQNHTEAGTSKDREELVEPATIKSPTRILKRGEKDAPIEITNQDTSIGKKLKKTKVMNQYACLENLESEEEGEIATDTPMPIVTETALVVVGNENFLDTNSEEDDNETSDSEDEGLEEVTANEVQVTAPDPSRYLVINQKPKQVTTKRITRSVKKSV
ncbi:hypothetical protein FRX31_008918 [Thalictrum thalictroides]|uniref:DUF4283 domain-containing protein n=1 Tax=Thalictrum thalictroides TaxID=46969 RepID=A0A7J6WVT3_THATH|nr:hypothetical protein FRX31_008918 [Thalictrum thalictroides]